MQYTKDYHTHLIIGLIQFYDFTLYTVTVLEGKRAKFLNLHINFIIIRVKHLIPMCEPKLQILWLNLYIVLL